MSIKKICYLVCGGIALGLGAFGAVVPLIPTVPFLLLAAYCFAKSSERVHNWFIETKLYQNNLQSFVEKKGMPWSAKIRIMTVVTILMAVGFIMMSNVPIGRGVLVVVWVCHILYFLFGIKTNNQLN